MKEKTCISNQFINARYNYSPIEIDIMLHVIARLDANSSNRQVNIHFREILTNDHRHAGIQYVKTACSELLKKPYEIWDGQKYWLTNFFSTAEVDPKTEVITLIVSDKMFQIILDIKKEFTALNLKHLLNLDGKNAKRLYMLACQFQKTGTRIIELDVLRITLGVNYPDFKDLRDRVITPALNEINEKTDLFIVNVFGGVGRKIERMTWTIAQKGTIQTVNYVPNVEDADAGKRSQIRARLIQYGCKGWFADNVLHTLELKDITAVLYKMQTAKNPINNHSAYLWQSFVNLGVPQTKIELQTQYQLEDLHEEIKAIQELQKIRAAK